MKKILFMIFVCSTLYAGESLKQTLLGYNNPNGRTGMITFKPSMGNKLSDDESKRTKSSEIILPLTDYITITHSKAEVKIRTGFQNWGDWESTEETNVYFHIPIYKLFENKGR